MLELLELREQKKQLQCHLMLIQNIVQQMQSSKTSGKKYLMLRLSSDSFNGCDQSCGGGCKIKRYYLDPPTLSITVTGPPPTSAWAFKNAEDKLQYKVSDHEDTNGMNGCMHMLQQSAMTYW